MSSIKYTLTLCAFALLAVASGGKTEGGSQSGSDPSAITTVPIGTAVETGSAEWKILEATDYGTTMKATDGVSPDAKTAGRFLQVKLTVANHGKKEGTLSAPKLIDDKQREFDTYIESNTYRSPKELKGIFLNKVAAGSFDIYVQVYEVPADATGLAIKLADFGIWGKEKRVLLPLTPAAGRADSSKAGAVAKTSAKPAAPATPPSPKTTKPSKP